MNNIRKAVQRSRRQSEWFHKKTMLPTKVEFDNVEIARKEAEEKLEKDAAVAKVIVEYDWKLDKYVNHYLGPKDSYEGTYAVYGTFQRETNDVDV